MAFFNKFGNFLLTNSGRNVSMYGALGLSLGIIGFKTLPQTIFVDEYLDVIRLYKHGMSVPVPEELRKRFDKAVELVGIPENERKFYKPFMVFGFDVYHAGTPLSKYGAKVGMPINFTYTDPDLIDKHMIRINNESVQWDLEEAKQLLQSMVMSEAAQLYGIARELKMVESAKFILESGYALLGVLFCYGFCSGVNQRYNLYAKPRGLRFIMYALVTAFSFGNYAFFKDFTQLHYEEKVDKFLKEKDPIFREGGKEFYEKLMQRNRAYRTLLGKAGESIYSVTGNENYFIRQKHTPVLHRKEFFEEKQESLL